MNCHNFTPQQRELLICIVENAEHSRCNVDEVIEVLTELLGCMLAELVPTREELVELLDKTMLPHFRDITLEFHDNKRLKI